LSQGNRQDHPTALLNRPTGERLRRAVTGYLRLAGFPYGEVAALMLRSG